jgi:hypothetical protein
VATYFRVSVPDVTRCAKTGLFKPSMNSSDDHETAVVREPADKRTAERRDSGFRTQADTEKAPVGPHPVLTEA